LFGGLSGVVQRNTSVLLPVEGGFYVWGGGTPTPSPTARFGHGMAFYPVSKFDVLFGGNDGSFIEGTTLPFLLGDTWNGSCLNTDPQWASVSPAHQPPQRWRHGMNTGPNGLKVVMLGGLDFFGHDLSETWNWGRQVACLPGDGSEIRVGSEVNCLFDTEFNQDAVFGAWSTIGFAPPFRTTPAQVFHTESPGVATITASWTDGSGAQSQTFHYTIVRPQH